MTDTTTTGPHFFLLDTIGELGTAYTLADVVVMGRSFGDRSRDVRVECVPGLVAWADPEHVWQILANYIENAFKYGAPPVEVSVTERDGWVELEVCDVGPGVPDEFVARLFERFSRGPGAQRQAEGAGLGLSIVRSLAEAVGGEAWYEARHPAGACFGVRVPSDTASEPPDGTGRPRSA